MNSLASRKLKYYMRLQYPVRVVLSPDGVRGRLPDLPGCEASAASTTQLYAELDSARRAYLHGIVMRGDDPPLPNQHLRPAPAPERPRRRTIERMEMEASR